FLYLSRSAWLRRFLERNPYARRMTKRFIAGQSLEEELAVCTELAGEGIWTTADHLGENVTSLADGIAARDAYLRTLDAIAVRQLPATISLKLTALGLDLSEAAAEEHLRTLAVRAKEIGSRVEVDMEDTRYTETTVRIAEAVGGETGCIRVCIQAYLYRSPDDLARLNRAKVMVRLCKGAYIEPAAAAMPEKSDVDAAYFHLAKLLLDHGTYPALATHDEKMIEAIIAYVLDLEYKAERFEFEMLHGVRRDLQRSVVQRGFHSRVYVPYGSEWYRYFMRRLAERPANVWFLVKNLFR
ncbi:MAG: proline dehydrogenase family protein, partial [Acidobacteriota bacterium]